MAQERDRRAVELWLEGNNFSLIPEALKAEGFGTVSRVWIAQVIRRELVEAWKYYTEKRR